MPLEMFALADSIYPLVLASPFPLTLLKFLTLMMLMEVMTLMTVVTLTPLTTHNLHLKILNIMSMINYELPLLSKQKIAISVKLIL